MRIMTRPLPLAMTTAAALVATTVLAAPSTAAPPAAGEPDVIVVPRFDEIAPFDGDGGGGSGDVGDLATEIQKPKRTGGNPLRRAPGSGSTVLPAGDGTPTTGAGRAKSNPEITAAWEGVNHRDSRLADGGDQFSGEPADLGVCVGNGYVLETVNSALRVYTTAGAPASEVISLNELYGLPPAINRSLGTFGPFTFDISCHFDPATDRWFHLAVDLDQNPATGAFTGRNYLDLAVSTSSDPTGSWVVYRIPGMNDGTEGTPDHGCTGGPCFADFPHIGADANGVYISTNEFDLFGPNFQGAQVYAISKAELVAGAPEIRAHLFNTGTAPWTVDGQQGFTVWPALSAGRQSSGGQGGTQYFVSSNAVFEDDGASRDIITWALSGTSTLDDESPRLRLTNTVDRSLRYAVPPSSAQKPGTAPLLACLNDTTGADGLLPTPCGQALFGVSPQNDDIGPIDTSDSRVLDVKYAQNRLWAVLGTAVEVGGEQRAGVGWFIIRPRVNAGGVAATIEEQGILAVEGESLAYPTLGVTTSGRGVIGFTRVGEELHPSQGYAAIDRLAGVGPVHMAREGDSVQDGFTEYSAFSNRPRWGDYGAAAVDGNDVYLTGQYVEQDPCDLQEWLLTGLECADQSRSALANWSTRVTKLRP